MIRDAAYRAHITAAAEAAPEPPRESVDLARRTLGPAIRGQRTATTTTTTTRKGAAA